MTLELSQRGHDMVLGALVADAASMGLHWLYDQDRIAQVAPEAPEFTEPDPKNYEGVPGYYAHGRLKTGDHTQYGAQLSVLLEVLKATDGIYDHATYAQAFRDHFGYGGPYVGYIDLATRESLNNHLRAEDEAMRRAKALGFDGDEMVTVAMVTKAMSLIGRLQGDALRAAFIETVKITHDGDDAAMDHGLAVLDEILAAPRASGAYDQQLPATSKLPALVAALEVQDKLEDWDAIDSAVRTTNDHPTALAYGRVTAAMMAAALKGADASEVVRAGREHATPEIAKLLDDALALESSTAQEVTKRFGMACDLNYAVPSIVHNVATAPSYREAIRRNILAGGDSCGRGILVGALMGALHGVDGDTGIPQEWIAKLNKQPF